MIANLRPTYQNLSITGGSEENESYFYLDPNLQLNYKPAKRHKLEFSAGLTHNPSGLSATIDNYLQLNYRTFYKGPGNNELFRSYYSFLSYTFGNWTDKYLLSSTLSYNYDEQYFGREVAITPNYNLIDQIVLEDRQSFGFGINIDRYFRNIRANVKLKSNFLLQNYNDLLNGSYRRVNEEIVSYGFEVRSGFTGWFNYTLGSDWDLNSYSYLDDTTSNLKNKSFLDLDFNLSQKLNFHIINERYYFRELLKKKSYYFTDLDLEYIFKKEKLSAHFKVNNLFNVENFSTYSISEIAEINRKTKIIPRYFMLGLKFHF